MNDRHILVVGSEGFVGKLLVPHLDMAGFNVVRVDNYSGGNCRDQQDPEVITSWKGVPDIQFERIVFLACQHPGRGKKFGDELEIIETLMGVADMSFGKFVFISSMAAELHHRINPLSEDILPPSFVQKNKAYKSYGARKEYLESYLWKRFHTPDDVEKRRICILRPHNILQYPFTPGSIVPQMIYGAIKDKKIHALTGSRRYTSANYLIGQILRARTGFTWDVVESPPIDNIEIAEVIASLTGATITKLGSDSSILNVPYDPGHPSKISKEDWLDWVRTEATTFISHKYPDFKMKT